MPKNSELVLLPRKPTKKMVSAGYDADVMRGPSAVYEAMVEAFLKMAPPVTNGECK